MRALVHSPTAMALTVRELADALFASKDRKGIKTQFDEVHAVRYGTSAPRELRPV